jgi:hypothetical protein
MSLNVIRPNSNPLPHNEHVKVGLRKKVRKKERKKERQTDKVEDKRHPFFFSKYSNF